MADKKKVLITILVAVIIVLVAIVVYALLIRPGINAYVVKNQNIGYTIGYQKAFLDIMQQAVTCQQVPLTLGNQTINVIAVGCLQ